MADSGKCCFTYCGADACDCDAVNVVLMGTVPDACPQCRGTGRMPLNTIGRRLKFLRQKGGVTTRQIPGLSSALCSQIETGSVKNPSADKLVIIADFFGVSVDWLLGRSMERPPQ